MKREAGKAAHTGESADIAAGRLSITRDDLASFSDWFGQFVRSHFSLNPQDQKNISLKIRHSANVRNIIVRLAHELGLSPRERLMAETAGLFHDIGRFPQYAKYKTFKDSRSVNHGRLGAEVLIGSGILDRISPYERDIVVNAVKFHNAYALPDLDDDRAVFFLKMVRDADKLDIWNIFLGLYENGPQDRASQSGLGLPEGAGYSEGVLSNLFMGRSSTYTELRTIDDFKLVQLSWLFDLNFDCSVRIFVENDYIDRYIALLPKDDAILKARDFLHAEAEARLCTQEVQG